MTGVKSSFKGGISGGICDHDFLSEIKWDQ